jgi:hypothetical protein
MKYERSVNRFIGMCIHGRSVLYRHCGRGYTKPLVAKGLDAGRGVAIQELHVAIIWTDECRVLAPVELVLRAILTQLDSDMFLLVYTAIRGAAHSPSIRYRTKREKDGSWP